MASNAKGTVGCYRSLLRTVKGPSAADLTPVDLCQQGDVSAAASRNLIHARNRAFEGRDPQLARFISAEAKHQEGASQEACFAPKWSQINLNSPKPAA
jgi:hypothetical protein